MFDIGWSEMAVVALIALLVIGPKELPNTLRMVGKWTRKARSLSREFRAGLDEMIREAELEDVRKTVESAKSSNIDKSVKNAIDPTGWVDKNLSEVDKIAKAEAPGEEATPQAAEKPAGETEQATVITHPTKIAPPHSLTPPAADEKEDDAGPAAPRGEETASQDAAKSAREA